MAPEEILELFFDNIKSLFFPELWLQLDLKFSKSELVSMLLIDMRHEITMTELADDINAPMSTANGVIERLVKKGYVVRDRSDADRRIVVVRLTGDGEALISGIKDMIAGYIGTALGALSEAETSTLISIVMKLVRVFQSRRAAGETQVNPELKKIIIE